MGLLGAGVLLLGRASPQRLSHQPGGRIRAAQSDPRLLQGVVRLRGSSIERAVEGGERVHERVEQAAVAEQRERRGSRLVTVLRVSA